MTSAHRIVDPSRIREPTLSVLARLRSHPLYLDLRWASREGWRRWWRRSQIQRQILATPPIRTAHSGPVEVRVLTWRRDWIDQVWALKTFYHFAGVDYPLYIHDGGLERGQAERLREHFPDANVISANEAAVRISAELKSQNLKRCLEYRFHSVLARRFVDFYCFSRADWIISIDSDVLFFRRPSELVAACGNTSKNLYNRDEGYWYAMSLDELESSFGVRPVGHINAGLSLVRRESIDFGLIERWLAHPKLFDEHWLTEQTVHALCSTIFGVEWLPDTYRVSTEPGLAPDLISKHYPGFFRRLHYEEGMTRLSGDGFIRALRKDLQR